MVYTRISNMKGHVLNPTSGFRTAFYDKQNGLWRQDSDMELIQSEETPAIHPYNYDSWVYHFSRQNMRPYSSHIKEDPEDSRPKTEEEIAALPENVAKAKKAAAEAAKLAKNKDDELANATKDASVVASEEKAAGDKALKEALDKADKPAPKKEAKKEEAKLAQVEHFYNSEVGLWMYDSTLVQGEGEGEAEAKPEVFEEEKVQHLEPVAYQNVANTNTPNMRTTFFLNQQQ
jgi:hypothetical protein